MVSGKPQVLGWRGWLVVLTPAGWSGMGRLRDAMPEVVARTEGRARLIVVGDSYLRPKFEASVPGAIREASSRTRAAGA